MQSKIVYTKYEKARIIGARALQLSMGAPLLIDINDDELKKINYSPIELAKIEFDKDILPITIKRPLPHKADGGLMEEPKTDNVNDKEDDTNR